MNSRKTCGDILVLFNFESFLKTISTIPDIWSDIGRMHSMQTNSGTSTQA